MRKHFQELQDEINDRFFREFEMRPFTQEEVSQVEQYFIPDEFFDNLERTCGSRTEMQTFLSTSRCEQLETYLQSIFDKVRELHLGEKIDGVFNCLESWESVRYISKENNLPLISYVFSSIRKPHGYQQTLYSANFDRLYCSDECEKRYNDFIKVSSHVPLFSNEEILAFIGKTRNIPLLKHLDSKPQKEMNICGEGFTMLPHIYERTHYNDEDIYYECNKIYKQSELGNRQHPIHLNSLQIDRSEVHNDPAAWILNARRLTAVCSQIVLKAILWKRTPIMVKNTLPFSFICSKDYSSTQLVPIEFINYYIFGYLIPSDLMFSDEYWKWRLSNPTEFEIYNRHLGYICENLNVDYGNLQNCNNQERLGLLLKSRGCDEQLMDYLLSDAFPTTIDYNVSTCRFFVNGKSYWRLNERTEDGYVSKLIFENSDVTELDFFPLDDVGGFVCIDSISINGEEQEIGLPSYQFYRKMTGHKEIAILHNGKVSVDIKWKYKTILEAIQ